MNLLGLSRAWVISFGCRLFGFLIIGLEVFEILALTTALVIFLN
jgi:hypothetical protein